MAGFGPAGHALGVGTLTRQAGNIRYWHDAAGRVVQRTRTRLSRKPETWRYEWDADNRLTSVITPDSTTWRYAYDPLGRRVGKRRVSASGEVLAETRFTWDGLVLAEQAELVPGGSGSESVTTWNYRPGTFTPLTQTTRASLRDAPQEVIDGEFYAIITDLTGTPSELVAPDGALAGFQQHTLWGGTFWHPGGASTPLRFPGQYADDETGLHYNNQRYYDPATGAYLSPDPLGLSPAPNPHTYVDNPHVLIDPLGLAADDSYIPWSSGGVARASRALDEGAKSVQVNSRSEAEELFLRKYQGNNYRNATGFDGVGTRQYFGGKVGTYHWDDQLGEDGRVLGHGSANRDGDLPHLQIHTHEGPIVRIFWSP
jgi:RHS repeat-associated protein